MPPARRLPPRTLSSHREIAQRECYCERAGCVAARPPPEPLGAAERQTFRASGYTLGTCTFPVHQHHGSTRRATSSTPGACAAQRRADPTATRPLPCSGSPTLSEDSLRTAGAAHTLWTGTSPMHPHKPGTRAPAAQPRQGPDTPWRPTCGSGQSPDAARALSRHFTQEKREARSCNSKSGRPVAATFAHGSGEKVSKKIVFHPPMPPSSTPPYGWRISHAKWNLLRKMDSFGEGTSRRGLVEEWGGVRWAAALPGAAGASVCPQSEAEPSGGANRLVMRRRTPLRQIESLFGVTVASGQSIPYRGRGPHSPN